MEHFQEMQWLKSPDYLSQHIAICIIYICHFPYACSLFGSVRERVSSWSSSLWIQPIAISIVTWKWISGGFKGASPPPNPRPKIFLIWCIFSETLAKSDVGTPGRLAPPPTNTDNFTTSYILLDTVDFATSTVSRSLTSSSKLVLKLNHTGPTPVQLEIFSLPYLFIRSRGNKLVSLASY